MASVTKSGSAVAKYGYDIRRLRVSKSRADGFVTHYHYDEQGQIIAETDGQTGETLRGYIWFSLSPIAVMDASFGTRIDRCSEDEMTRLRALGRPRANGEGDGTDPITTEEGPGLSYSCSLIATAGLCRCYRMHK